MSVHGVAKKKLIKIQLSIITFPLLQVLAQLGVGCARLASGTKAFAKAAGSFDACQRIEPPAEDFFYLLHIQAKSDHQSKFVWLPWIWKQIIVPFSSKSCVPVGQITYTEKEVLLNSHPSSSLITPWSFDHNGGANGVLYLKTWRLATYCVSLHARCFQITSVWPLGASRVLTMVQKSARIWTRDPSSCVFPVSGVQAFSSFPRISSYLLGQLPLEEVQNSSAFASLEGAAGHLSGGTKIWKDNWGDQSSFF